MQKESGLQDIATLKRLMEQVREHGSAASAESLDSVLDAVGECMERVLSQAEERERRIARLLEYQRQTDARLGQVENSAIFRTLRWFGSRSHDLKVRLGQRLLHSPLHPVYIKLRGGPGLYDFDYVGWLRTRHREASCAVRRASASTGAGVRFSVVIPVHNPRLEWLACAVNSVKVQSYPVWQLCICDDASQDPEVARFLDAEARGDSRICWLRSEENIGISNALNRAGSLATGEYVGFLDHDDELAPIALERCVAAIEESSPDLIYTDEEVVDDCGQPQLPVFKPDWSPDLLASCMYMGHFLVVSKAAIDRAGWFRAPFDGGQDYDLALRLTDERVAVRHIPEVLYHWRRHSGSTAGNPGVKPYAHHAGARALGDAIARRGWRATVADGASPATYHVVRKLDASPLVSIVICSKNRKLLSRCVRGIERVTGYPHREIVVVQHCAAGRRPLDRFLAGSRYSHVAYDGAFNFAEMNNLGAGAARGEALVFLNDDTLPLAPGWLESLVQQVQRPEVGVVGAKLVYPSGTIEHAGMVVGILDGAAHPARGSIRSRYWQWTEMTRNVSAVTGACLAVRKDVFRRLGGFDCSFPVNYNDVDLCLKARSAGFEVLYEPRALLRHDGCRTRLPGVGFEERERFHQKWAELLAAGDPYYNRNLTTRSEDASLRFEEY